MGKEQTYTLMEHNNAFFQRHLGYTGDSVDRVATRIVCQLDSETVGRSGYSLGIIPQFAVSRYMEPMYPGVRESPQMTERIHQLVRALQQGTVEIIPDFDENGQINFDSLCEVCMNNDHGSCEAERRMVNALAEVQKELLEND